MGNNILHCIVGGALVRRVGLLFLRAALYSLFFILYSPGVEAETLYILPQAQEVYEGDTFLVEVRIDGVERDLGQVTTTVILADNRAEIFDAWYAGSVLSFAQPTTSSQESASFEGDVAPGFIGDGLIGRIMIQAQNIGQGVLEFDNASTSLNAAGGERKPVFLEATYEVVERPQGLISITSRNHQDQTQWHGGKTVHLSWPFNEESLYSFAMNLDPIANLDEIPDRPTGELKWIGDMEYQLEEDGIYYFHLKECQLSENSDVCVWGPKTTHRIMIDSQPPNPFEVYIVEKYGVSYAAILVAQDSLSGIDHYEISERPPKTLLSIVWGESDTPHQWRHITARHRLEDQSLSSSIFVKAIDRAGNERILEVVPAASFHILDENILLLTAILITLLLIATGSILWFILTREKRSLYAN